MGQQKFTYKGMTKDLAKSKKNPEYYYDAKNIRIVATDEETTLSLTTEKGNVLTYSLTAHYGALAQILGHCEIDKYIVLFVYYDVKDHAIRLINIDTGVQTSLISGDLNFQLNTYFSTEVFYENENTIKVYWADGINQQRFINILDPTTNISLLDVCPSYIISSPILESVTYGGIHTAGMIQYGYNLLKKGGQQTPLSPLSELYPLKKVKGGGKLNEIVGQINHIIINNVDRYFDIIRVYSIKYTSYNQEPVISLICEDAINNNVTFRYADDGRVIYGMSQEELIFLGNSPIVPKYLGTKYNRLILGDIQESYFDISTEVYDTRAYRFNKYWVSTGIKNVNEDALDIVHYDPETSEYLLYREGLEDIEIPVDHDCITPIETTAGEGTITVDTVEIDLQSNQSVTSVALEPSPSINDLPYYADFTGHNLVSNIDRYISIELTLFYERLFGRDIITKKGIVSILPAGKNILDELIYIFANGNSVGYFGGGAIPTGEGRRFDSINQTNYASHFYLPEIYNGFEVSKAGNYFYYKCFLTTTGEPVIIDATFSIYNTKIVPGIPITVETIIDEGAVYQYNSAVWGASGNNIDLRINQSSTTADSKNVLKSGEIYRFGIEFFNDKGQVTEPKWICDLKIPRGNLHENYNTLEVNLKNSNILSVNGVVGYRILRVDRTDIDKTIITQGIINPSIFQEYDPVIDVPKEDPPKDTLLYAESPNPYESALTLVGIRKTEDVEKYFIKLPSPFMRNMGDLEDDPISTFTEVPPFPFNLFMDIMYGQDYTPKINKIQNGNMISYPIMGGELEDSVYVVDPDNRTGWRTVDLDSITNRHVQHPNYPFPEVFKKFIKNEMTSHETYQFTKMFQLYSPELIFLNPILGNNLKYTIVGKLDNNLADCSVWGKQIATTDDSYFLYDADFVQPDKSGGALEDVVNTIEAVVTNIVEGIKSFVSRSKIVVKKGDIINSMVLNKHFHLFNKAEKRAGITLRGDTNNEKYTSLHKNGLIGPSGGRSQRQNLYQYYREYKYDSTYTPQPVNRYIAGNPEVIGKGESHQIYQDNTLSSDMFTFNNHLFTIITDINNGDPNETEAPIVCVNSIGANCLNIVDLEKKDLEDILASYNILSGTGLVEVSKTLENQYGGNTYEARSRNAYLEIGRYYNIGEPVAQIDHAGDTFVSNFMFERIIPNIAQVESNKYMSMCEIVEFPVESSIDLDCRDDISISGWNAMFHPSFDEFHSYNRVYSQQPILNVKYPNPFTFEPIKHFTNKILTTKVKTPGEIVDSWTDILINEELCVNGAYGKLTKLIKNNDELYFFQDNALGILQIQPRVAIQASDGVGVELGTGTALYNYQYLSTASGSTNPNCIFNSPNYIYYLDVTNRTLNRVNPKGVEGLSDPMGLHSFMYNNILKSYDNSLLAVGIYDNINDEAYFTCPYVDALHPGFTLVYNESLEGFTSFYDFLPKFYLKVPGRLFSCNNSRDLYEHFLGDYCNFYSTALNEYIYDSTITFFANPQQDGGLKTRFDNISFNAELTKDDVDIFLDEDTNTYTLPIKKVQVTTDYQQTQDTTLVYGTHIKRKFRNWSLVIPRAYNFTLSKNTLDRMRGEWAYIKLTIDNTENNKLVLHDVILSFE